MESKLMWYLSIVFATIERQELHADIDADEVASILIAMLEGAIILSNLYKDPVHMKRAANHVVNYIETVLSKC